MFVVVGLLGSKQALADEPMTHDGFYLRFGIGGGHLSSTLEVEGSSSEMKISGAGAGLDLLIGGTPAPGVVIGGAYFFNQAQEPTVEIDGEELGESEANFNFGVLGPFVDVFFDPHGGFHAGAVIGPAIASVSDDSGDTDATATGFGGGAFVGYDAWVSDQWALGGLFRFTAGSVSDDVETVAGTASETLHPLSFTVMFSALHH